MNNPNDKLSELFRIYRKLHYKKGEIILRATEQPKGVYFLEKGFLKLYSVSKKAEELTLIIFKPGDIFPYIWTFGNTLNGYYLEAMVPSDLYLIPKDSFLETIKKDHELLLLLTHNIVVRLGGLLTRMEYLRFGNSLNKVASILVICADRFGLQTQDGILIQVPLTHQDIANLIGTARETVSLEIKKLERADLLFYKGKNISIKNLARLKEEASMDS